MGGKLYVTSTGIGINYSPIGNILYDNLTISALTFTRNEKSGGVDVFVEISGGNGALYSDTVTIAILNF